ncbi:MAG TPA: lysyl oxidase family protein [Pilimelia sp.]|nr:lysyl oxidase family protein [Pilimelia sp.]
MIARSRRHASALTAAGVIAALTAGTPAAAAPKEPPLRFVAAASTVTIERWEGEPVFLDLGTHVVAGKTPFEVRAKRASYAKPIVATQVVRSGGKKKEVRLPAGLVTDFSGLSKFTHVTLKNAAGETVVEQDQTFCPNAEGSRVRPDAPDRSPYPRGCSAFTPFVIGSVWGIQAGWSASTSSPWGYGVEPLDLPDGTYTATVSVNQPYRNLFGFPANQSTATVKVVVKTVTDPGTPRGMRTQGGPAGAATPAPGVPLKPAAHRPTGKPNVPKGPKPDLRALPAFQIQIAEDEPGHPHARADEGDFLAFAANVWVAGDSPLVVDGFRRANEDVMDAYQYFYDSKGKQVGYAPVGTMEWDDRDGHNHWHFTDFAQYRLLDASKQLAVRSGKEAFCLANTDAIDYTLPHANWRPENTDLHTACGHSGSLSVREVLDVGNGDTYMQFLPGQSFDITDLPNGTYYIEVAANPDRRLFESNTKNNASLRKVILGGEPGARTVTVPPHGLIDG